jgi:membrane-bound ClpP family serine protease
MELVGQRGMSISKMIPSGSVTIAGQHYDAISQSGAISEGQAIKVVAVDGTRILVRELEPDELNADPGEDSSAATGPDRLIPDPFDE